MKTLTFKADCKFQRATITKGTIIQVSQFAVQGIRFEHEGAKFRVGWGHAHKYFKEFSKVPTLKKIERWSADGVCKTPTGEKVEPDGHDKYGVPSWLMIFGFA